MLTPTLQEIFDLCVGHIIKQGEPSFDEKTGECYYTHPEKPHLHCAAWPMLKEYSPELEGLPASKSIVWRKMGLNSYGDEVQLIQNLQAAHDEAAKCPPVDFITEFKRRVINVAVKFNINTQGIEIYDTKTASR